MTVTGPMMPVSVLDLACQHILLPIASVFIPKKEPPERGEHAGEHISWRRAESVHGWQHGDVVNERKAGNNDAY